MANSDYIKEGFIDDAPTVFDVSHLVGDILSGKIFGSWMLPKQDEHLIPNIFIPSLFMDELQAKEMQRDDIQYFYAYMKNACMFMNGYPQFMRIHTLSATEFLRLAKLIDDEMELQDG